MRLRSVEIEGFRSFGLNPEPIVFPDVPRPISIIGANNSGKTNLLAALLHATGVRSTYPTAFSEEDFYQRDLDTTACIKVVIAPPLKSADAFNNVTDMPVLQLRIYSDEGSIETKHDCCDESGKPVWNARAIKRSKSKVYSEEERAILTAYQRSGGEPVHRWRSKIPVFFLSPETLSSTLGTGRYSLLGKVIESFRREFEDPTSLMEAAEGVVAGHVGKPRNEVYAQAMKYLEDHVIPTTGFSNFVAELEEVIREQLDIDDESFAVRFRPPEAEFFFKNLRFDIRENADRPLIPVDRMGSGFLSLFVVALLRVLVSTDEGGKVFLLEEPETYLHEHFQEYFYSVLCELAKENQVIYTTHSKKFVDFFHPETIIRLVGDPDGTRAIQPKKGTVDFTGEVDGLDLSDPEDFAKYLRTLEPNLGNVAFASRVVVVEGPHDVLGYKTTLETVHNLGLKNTAVVSAWGKDPIGAVVQVCKALEIPCFVIHDRDLPNDLDDGTDEEVTPAQKAQRTKNQKLADLQPEGLHLNRPNLEAVLGIPLDQKSAAAVFERLDGKSLQAVRTEFPGFVPDDLLSFLGVPPNDPTEEPDP